jgi:hypothetical protein
MSKVLDRSILLKMQELMTNETINKKVELAPGEGKTYARFDVQENGTVLLGETRFRFWNQLIGCQRMLSFESWALAVWDALVDLSTGGNATAIEEGLSVEIAKKAQREENYEWVVRRLMECYEHVCNNKDGKVSAGTRDKNGSIAPKVVVHDHDNPVNLHVNIGGTERFIRIPDATGRAGLKVKVGVTGVETEMY